GRTRRPTNLPEAIRKFSIAPMGTYNTTEAHTARAGWSTTTEGGGKLPADGTAAATGSMEQNYIADTFRRWGHLQAKLDDLGRMAPAPHRDIDALSGPEAERWREIYCGKIGAEFMHMPFPERCDWVARRME